MITSINDGGPAFPYDWKDFQPSTGEQVVRESFPGMSLRDYFAAKALPAVLTDCERVNDAARANGRGTQLDKNHVARSAYNYADAMLEARETKQ